MAWSTPQPTKRRCAARSEQGFRGIKDQGGRRHAANDERGARACGRAAWPRCRTDDRLQPARSIPQKRRGGFAASPLTICSGSDNRRPGKSSGHAKSARDIAETHKAGENWWFLCGFHRRRQAPTSSCHLMKCGGVTVAAQARPPTFQCRATCSRRRTPTCLSDANRALVEFLDFAQRDPRPPGHGTVTARGPGLGLEWNETAVAKYVVG